MATNGHRQRALVVGYGNVYRSDDGVAHAVVNSLRRRLEQPDLSEDETGLDSLGASTDSVFLVQLTPELLDAMQAYAIIVFVDAHVMTDAPDLDVRSVCIQAPASSFTHHMTPEMLLGLLMTLCGATPCGYIVSIRGREFSFGRRLSQQTEALVEPAVDSILGLIGSPHHNSD
jgi:hydrogenase maturation protease